MKRAVVIGCPGAGKSTFARKLAEKTKLPLIHLDYYYHQKAKNYNQNKEQWFGKVRELTKGEKWIIDGNYSSTLSERIKTVDTIFFLDFPRPVSVYRVLKRRIEYRSKLRPDMPSNWKEKVDWEFFKFVWRFNKNSRPKIIDALRNADKKEVIVF